MDAFVGRLSDRRLLWSSIGLALLCLLVFGQSVVFEFVWDDGDLIVTNPVVRGEAPLVTVFTTDFWWVGGSDAFSHNFWRPLTLLYYRALSVLVGGPWAFHLASVCLHVAVVILFFLVLCVNLPMRSAFFAAALFSIHPLRVESVVWVSSAGDLLCAAGLLLSLLLLEAGGDRGTGKYLGSLFAFGLALLSKETAFVFPLVLTLRALVDNQRTARRAGLMRSVPFWILAVILFIVRGQVLGATGLSVERHWQDLLTAPVLLTTYLVEMTLPVNHSIHSAMVPVEGLRDPRLWGSLGILSLIGGFLFVALPRVGRKLLLPLTWTVLFLVPVCMGQFAATIYSERYTYIPALGFSVVLAAGLVAMTRIASIRVRGRPAHAVVGAVLLVLAFSAVSVRRIPSWRDNNTLYSAMLKQNRSDTLALFNLGMGFVERGDVDTAETYFLQTVRVAPKHSPAHNSLGNIAWIRKDFLSAERHFREALSGSEANSQALFNLARLLDEGGRCEEAREYYRRFIAQAPLKLSDVVEGARQAREELDRKKAFGLCRDLN